MRRLAGVLADQFAKRLGRLPVRHELARSTAATGINEGRSVPDRTAQTALGRHQSRQIGECRRDRQHATRRLQTEAAGETAGIRIEPPPSVPCDKGKTPAASAAEVPAEEPNVGYSGFHGLRVT